MFSSSNKVEIFTEKNAYQPGETIKGYVETKVFTKQAVKGIHLTVYGLESSKVVKSDGNTTITYTGTKPLICSKFIINDFVGDVEVGNYTVPFEIKLPFDIPSSFIQVSSLTKFHCEIMYSLKAVVLVSSTFSFDWKFEKFFSVYDITDLVSSPVNFKQYDQKVKSCCCIKEGTFDAFILIDGDVFGPGDTIKGTLEVVSNSSKKINCSIALKKNVTAIANCTESKEKVITKVNFEKVGNGERVIIPFSLTIPIDITHGTHSSELMSCYYSVSYSIGYGWNTALEDGPYIFMKNPFEKFALQNQISAPLNSDTLSSNNQQNPPAYLDASKIDSPQNEMIFSEKK